MLCCLLKLQVLGTFLLNPFLNWGFLKCSHEVGLSSSFSVDNLDSEIIVYFSSSSSDL